MGAPCSLPVLSAHGVPVATELSLNYEVSVFSGYVVVSLHASFTHFGVQSV